MRFITLLLALLLANGLQAQITESNGKYGYRLGEEWMIPPEYDTITYLKGSVKQPFEAAKFLLWKNGNCGLFYDNQLSIPILYDALWLEQGKMLYGDVEFYRAVSGDSLGLVVPGMEGNKWYLGPCKGIHWLNDRFCVCEQWTGGANLIESEYGEFGDTLYLNGIQAWQSPSKQELMVKKWGKWYLWTEDYGQVREGFDSIAKVADNESMRYWVQAGSGKGFYDLDADFFLPPLFDSLQFFRMSKYEYGLAVRVNDYWGLILPEGPDLQARTFSGQWALAPVFDKMTLGKDVIHVGLAGSGMDIPFRDISIEMNFPFFDTEDDLQERTKEGIIPDSSTGIYSWKGKYGWISEEGFRCGPIWDEVRILEDNQLMLARLNGKYAVFRYPYIGSQAFPPVFDTFMLIGAGKQLMELTRNGKHCYIAAGNYPTNTYLPLPLDSVSPLGIGGNIIWKGGVGYYENGSIIAVPFQKYKEAGYRQVEISGSEGMGLILGSVVIPPVFDSVFTMPVLSEQPLAFVKQLGFWRRYDPSFSGQQATFRDSLLIHWNAYQDFRARSARSPYNDLVLLMNGYYKKPVFPALIYLPDIQKAMWNNQDWMEEIRLPYPLKNMLEARQGYIAYVSEQGDTILMHKQHYTWIPFEKLTYPGQVYAGILPTRTGSAYYFHPEPSAWLEWYVPEDAVQELKLDTLHGLACWRISVSGKQGLYFNGRFIPPEFQQVEIVTYTKKGWSGNRYHYLLQNTDGKCSWYGEYGNFENKKAAIKNLKKRLGKGVQWVQ